MRKLAGFLFKALCCPGNPTGHCEIRLNVRQYLSECNARYADKYVVGAAKVGLSFAMLESSWTALLERLATHRRFVEEQFAEVALDEREPTAPTTSSMRIES